MRAAGVPNRSASIRQRRAATCRPATPPPASQLYPPGGQWRTADWGATGAAGLELGAAEYQLQGAHEELTAARAAADKEPSEANIARVQKAEVNVGLMTYLARTGLGTAASYPLSATKLRYSYPQPRFESGRGRGDASQPAWSASGATSDLPRVVPVVRARSPRALACRHARWPWRAVQVRGVEPQPVGHSGMVAKAINPADSGSVHSQEVLAGTRALRQCSASTSACMARMLVMTAL